MKLFVIMAFAAISLASGCASMQELTSEVIAARKTGKEGVTKVYPVTKDQAWDITTAVFHWEKTDEIDERRDENYVITSTGMKMVLYGSVMGIWIEPVDSDNTRLTVISKRRVQSDKFTRLTEATFFKRFEQGVNIIKCGRKLPVMPP